MSKNVLVHAWRILLIPAFVSLSAAAQPVSNYHGESITGVSPKAGVVLPASSNAISISTPLAGGTFQFSMPSNNVPEFIISDGEKYLSVPFTKLASFTYRTQEVAGANSDGVDTTIAEAQIPVNIKSFNEKSVAVTGFMLPLHSSGDLATDFLLLRNQSACCYGVMPKITEWVLVRTTGKGVKVTMDIPVTVLGTLHVGEIRENGQLSGIYKLDCDKVMDPKS